MIIFSPAAIASRNSMGSYNGEEDDAPAKTTVVLSHARGTDPSLATSVAPEEARVVGLWVARPAAPPVPTLRDVAAVEKLRETARDAILLVVTCEGASARYRCFVGGHAVRPCRVRVRTLTHDSRREYEACPDGVCGRALWGLLLRSGAVELLRACGGGSWRRAAVFCVWGSAAVLFWWESH